MTTISRKKTRAIRHKRIRARVAGTSASPRLAVFRSNRVIYAQLIDDSQGTTLGAASSKDITGGMLAAAQQVGTAIAKLAQSKGITKVVFDRGGFSYTGTIKALADGAREAGLVF
jgi:large subunit ribosomal protein L18